jgi:hypothetical protein
MAIKKNNPAGNQTFTRHRFLDEAGDTAFYGKGLSKLCLNY